MSEKKLSEFIGSKIYALRKKSGYNQENLADLLGLTRTSVVNIEKGRQNTTSETIYLVCRVFRCTPNDLFPRITTIKIKKTITETIVKQRVKLSIL